MIAVGSTMHFVGRDPGPGRIVTPNGLSAKCDRKSSYLQQLTPYSSASSGASALLAAGSSG